MQESVKQDSRTRWRLSDRQLHAATKLMRGAELWCASGVLFWGAGLLLGGGVLGLKAVGVAVPAAIGVSSLVFSGVMAAKSVVLRQAFRKLHKKGLAAIEKRGQKPLPQPTPSEAPTKPFFHVARPRRSFNAKAQIAAALSRLPHPGQQRSRTKIASPGGPRLPL
jgi:hypothetical protein